MLRVFLAGDSKISVHYMTWWLDLLSAFVDKMQWKASYFGQGLIIRLIIKANPAQEPSDFEIIGWNVKANGIPIQRAFSIVSVHFFLAPRHQNYSSFFLFLFLFYFVSKACKLCYPSILSVRWLWDFSLGLPFCTTTGVVGRLKPLSQGTHKKGMYWYAWHVWSGFHNALDLYIFLLGIIESNRKGLLKTQNQKEPKVNGFHDIYNKNKKWGHLYYLRIEPRSHK